MSLIVAMLRPPFSRVPGAASKAEPLLTRASPGRLYNAPIEACCQSKKRGRRSAKPRRPLRKQSRPDSAYKMARLVGGKVEPQPVVWVWIGDPRSRTV